MHLRPYQQDAIDAVYRHLRERDDNPVVVIPTAGGKTPILPGARLQELGFKVAIYPNSLTRLFARAGQELLAGLKVEGGTAAFADRMLDHNQLWTLFENERWQALEKKFQN